MRKAFDRLRRWLIKKLGGYTEQFPPLQRQIEKVESVRLQKVQAQIRINATDGKRRIDDCECRALERLAMELQASGCVRWDRLDEVHQISVWATLYVANANDLTPRFQCWVE